LGFQGTERFQLVQKLGEGGMGVVYEAYDAERDMHVALKTLRHMDASSLYRFKREFRSLTDISHPNIIGLYELVCESDDWFFTMELLEGVDFIRYVRAGTASMSIHEQSTGHPVSPHTLETREISTGTGEDSRGEAITGRHPGVGAFEFDELVDERRLRRALVQLARALETLHRSGKIHRDLKPSNVRVTPTGRVVLMDFGIVAEASVPDDSNEPRLVGTPSYMAPEQAAGEPPSAAADWYSYGALMYLALTGQLPFEGGRQAVLMAKQSREPAPPESVTDGVPRDLARLCSRLLRRDPLERPSGAEVLTALGVETDEPIDDALTTAGGISVFVGRERELELLDQAYETARSGSPVAVTIQAISGMGKSTLVRRFLHELEARRAARDLPVVLRGRCHERESLSYKAFDTVIDHLSHFLLGLSPERVHNLLPEDVDLLTRLFPVLRRVPGIQTARPLGGLDPQELRQRAFAVLRELLRRIADWRPVVLYIDDLQWADPDSLELLVEVTREPDAPSILLLVAIREENLGPDEDELRAVLDGLEAQQIVHSIELGPLSRDEQQLLVGRLLGDKASPEILERDLWRESAGSPFFIGELVRFVRDDDGALSGGNKLSLEDVLYRRIVALPDHARTLLQAVCVAGRPTAVDILGTAVDLGPVERERASAILRATNLVRVARRTRELWLAPYHDRIRETVTERIALERLRDLHQRIAQSLERSEDASVDALARHWLAAGDRHHASRYLVSAAESATEKLAFGRAADLYRAALELGDHGPHETRSLYRHLADSLSMAGRYYDAAGAYHHASLGADHDDTIELSRRRADCLLRSGHVVDGLEALRDVTGLLRISIPRSRRRALLSLGFRRARLALRGLRHKTRSESQISARNLGRLDTLYAASTTLAMIDHVRGADLQARHLLEALRFGEESRVCRALATEAVYKAAAGGRNRRKAEAMSQEVELLARRIGDPYLIALAHLALGAAGFFGARPRRAFSSFSEAERILSKEVDGADWEHITASFFTCFSQIHLGELGELSRTVERFISEAERRKDLYALNLFRTQPNTWRWLTADDPDRAEAELDRALDGWPEDEYFMAHHLVAMARTLVHFYRGEWETAHQLLLDSLPGIRRSMIIRIPWVMAEYWAFLGRSALMIGDEKRLRRAIRYLRRLGFAATDGAADGLSAARAERAGDLDTARELLLRGVRECEEIEFHCYAASFRYRLGALGGGDSAQLMEQARVWLSERGVLAPEKMIELFAPSVAAAKLTA
jgi:serine/threonine protein kinase